MQSLKKSFLFLLVVGVGVAVAQGLRSQRTITRLQLTNYAQQMRDIRQAGFDVAGVNFPEKQVDLIVDEGELRSIKEKGLLILPGPKQGEMMTPDAQYQNPAKVEQALRALNTQYPNLTELTTIGKSLEGRDIWAIKITNKATTAPTKKPVLLINAMHHAREIMTSEIPLDMAQYLLSNYGKDAKVTHWVDANEIWLIPMFNVDGNTKVWSSDSFWRKNTRGGYGVDINRNYPYAWNSCDGSSDSQWAQDFHGDSAGSEPETQNMVNFVSRIRPVFDISFHSYSELVIYPYGCHGKHTETADVVESIGRQIAQALPSDSGRGTYTAGIAPDLLYDVDGSDIDWMYHEAQVIPYVIEVNSSSQGFQPSYAQWRDKTVTKLRAAWTILLERLDGSGLRGLLTNAQGQNIDGSTVAVERTGGQPFAQTYRVNADGTFHIVLNPGTYKVTYSASGYQAQTAAVTIGAQRTDVTVSLQK